MATINHRRRPLRRDRDRLEILLGRLMASRRRIHLRMMRHRQRMDKFRGMLLQERAFTATLEHEIQQRNEELAAAQNRMFNFGVAIAELEEQLTVARHAEQVAIGAGVGLNEFLSAE